MIYKLKKIVALGLAFAIFTGGLAGCASSATPAPTTQAPAAPAEATSPATPETSEQKTVKVWWWGEGDTPGSKAWLEETAKAYQAEHPNITIDLVEQTTDQLYPAWEAAITAQDGPDIQFLWTGIWALQYVWDGEVADLNDLIPESEMKHWQATEGLSYQGRPWLVPWYRISIVMMYNKDLLIKAGLDPNNPPKNYDELLAACEAIKLTGVIPFEQGGMKDGWGAAWLYSSFAPAEHNSIGDFVNMATQPGAFTQPENKKWLEQMAELSQKGCTDPETMSLDFFQGREAFHQGKAAFGLATNGQAIQWINDMGGEEHVGIMRFPEFGSGSMSGGLNVQTHSFAIPKFAKNKQEAADFLVFMHTPDRLKRWYELTKNFPADDRFDPSVIQTQSEKDVYQYLTDDSIPYAEIYIPVQVDTEGVYSAVQKVFSGGTADEAAQMIEDTAQKWRTVDPSGVTEFENWAKEFSQ